MLGILPEIINKSAKAILLVEGKDDVLFFNHINELLKQAGEIEKTFTEKNIIILCTGGCDNLKYWVTKKIIEQFRLPWYVFLDSDRLDENGVTKNTQLVEKLNLKKIRAFCTRKREIENYLHIDLLRKNFPALQEVENFSDMKKLTVNKIFEKNWKNMNFEQFRERETYIDGEKEHFELTEIIKQILSSI